MLSHISTVKNSLFRPFAILIEVGGESVGLALREGETYRFVALEPRFSLLDGSRFRDPRQAESAARSLQHAQGESSCR